MGALGAIHPLSSPSLCPVTATSSLVLLGSQLFGFKWLCCVRLQYCTYALWPHFMDFFYTFLGIKSTYFTVHRQIWNLCVYAAARISYYFIYVFQLLYQWKLHEACQNAWYSFTRYFLFSLCTCSPHWHMGWNPVDALTALPTTSSYSSPPMPLHSLSSWQRRTCRLVFMVSCDPSPPPQCSWFSRWETEEKRRGVRWNHNHIPVMVKCQSDLLRLRLGGFKRTRKRKKGL